MPAVPRRDLEIQLKMEQVHIAPASGRLASHRTAGAGAGGTGGAYRNYGERLYVEGRLDAMRREQSVSGLGGLERLMCECGRRVGGLVGGMNFAGVLHHLNTCTA